MNTSNVRKLLPTKRRRVKWSARSEKVAFLGAMVVIEMHWTAADGDPCNLVCAFADHCLPMEKKAMEASFWRMIETCKLQALQVGARF